MGACACELDLGAKQAIISAPKNQLNGSKPVRDSLLSPAGENLRILQHHQPTLLNGLCVSASSPRAHFLQLATPRLIHSIDLRY